MLALFELFIVTVCTAIDDRNIEVIFEKLNNITDEFNARAKMAVARGATIVPGSVPRSDIEDQLKKVNISQTLRGWLELFVTTEGNIAAKDMDEVIDLYSSAEKTVFSGLDSLYGYATNGSISTEKLADATLTTLQASQDVSLLTSHLFMNLIEFVELFSPVVGLDNLIAGTPAFLDEYKQLNLCLQRLRNHSEGQSGKPCYFEAIKAIQGIMRDIDTSN